MKAFRYLRDAAVFAPCYVLLDWVSYIEPLGPFNITPWNPQPALAIVWMVLGGLAHAPAVFVTIFGADALIRQVPAGYGVTLLTALTLTLGYTGIAWALRVLLRPRPSLDTVRQLTLFVSSVMPATAVVAAAFVGVLYASGFIAASAALPGWLRFWIGDAVGVLVTAPLLLVVSDEQGRRQVTFLAGRGETYAYIILLAATLWLIFEGLRTEPSQHFYLLFLPLIWMAVRRGMAAAILAIVIIQLGVVLGIHHHAGSGVPAIEWQAWVAALTLTGLYLGVMVDERARATESLKQTLRLAAAGEMAGAIAHEVNQPLTALTNYGRSAQLLIASGKTGELAAVIDRMLSETQRASEVVRRLRDFFRAGTTRLERVALSELLEAGRRITTDMKDAAGISVRVEAEPELPPVLVDRLQIELVLRNLLANAVEALRAHSPGSGQITLSAQRHDAHHVRIVVADNGPGIAAAAAAGERLFEPFVSGKSTGMGLGLAVSRAIAEAHGGSLQSFSRTHGEFQLVLPCEAARA
jgi:signal transduction histidine kinase